MLLRTPPRTAIYLWHQPQDRQGNGAPWFVYKVMGSSYAEPPRLVRRELPRPCLAESYSLERRRRVREMAVDDSIKPFIMDPAGILKCCPRWRLMAIRTAMGRGCSRKYRSRESGALSQGFELLNLLY